MTQLRPPWKRGRAALELALAVGVLFSWFATCATPSAQDVMSVNRTRNHITCDSVDNAGRRMPVRSFLEQRMKTNCDVKPVSVAEASHFGTGPLASTLVFVLVALAVVIGLPYVLSLGLERAGMRGDLTVAGVRLVALVLALGIGGVLWWARAEAARSVAREAALDKKLATACENTKKKWDAYEKARFEVCDKDPKSCNETPAFNEGVQRLKTAVLVDAERDNEIECPVAPDGVLANAKGALDSPRAAIGALIHRGDESSTQTDTPQDAGVDAAVTDAPATSNGGGNANPPPPDGGTEEPPPDGGSGSNDGGKKQDREQEKKNLAEFLVILGVAGVPGIIAKILGDLLTSDGGSEEAEAVRDRIAQHIASGHGLTPEDARDLAELAKQQPGSLEQLLKWEPFKRSDAAKEQFGIRDCLAALTRDKAALCGFEKPQLSNEQVSKAFEEQVTIACSHTPGYSTALAAETSLRFAKCVCPTLPVKTSDAVKAIAATLKVCP